MASRSSKRYLGEPVFCVSREGNVTWTVVSELALPIRSKRKGSDFVSLTYRMLDREPYSLLNGGGAHFFSLDTAIDEAEKVLQARIENPDLTKTQEQAARGYLAKIRTDAGKKEILDQSLVERSKILPISDRVLKKGEQFPTEYFKPGEKVFCLVTPETHYMCSPDWRPHPYFILVETVAKVSYSPKWPGSVYYGFTHTRYNFSHDLLCSDEVQARKKLQKVFAKQTGGTIEQDKIKVIEVSVEKKSQDGWMKEMIKRSSHLHP